MMSENPLHLLLNPKSIAVAGANNVPSKMGTIQALNIIKDGYPGKFFPIHPTEKTVLGRIAYPSPEDLPEVPDLAILIVPIKAVVPLLESFGKIGTKRAIVITAGFKETGSTGQDMEKQINAIAKHYRMRFVGPNCMGVINSQVPLNTTVLPMDKTPGFLGFASQSGTFLSQSLPYLKKGGFVSARPSVWVMKPISTLSMPWNIWEKTNRQKPSSCTSKVFGKGKDFWMWHKNHTA